MNSTSKRRIAIEDGNQSPPKKQKIALYLADNTPVRTIEVSHFADNVTSEYLRGYFQCASGPVSDVSIVAKLENNQNTRVGYVTFLLPEDAAGLICDPNMKSNNEFTFKQAKSDRQPKIDPSVLQLEDLNDDCFWYISSFLDLIDVVNLGKTSRRLQSFAHQIYRRHSKFSFGSTNTGDSSMNETNIETILEEMGTFIRTVEWHHLSVNHLRYLSDHCHNVDELTLINTEKRLHASDIKNYTKLFRGIKKLFIRGSSFFDTTLKMITTSSKLTSLELNQCPNIRGKFLSTWNKPKLECLKISNSLSIDCDNLYRFERKNPSAQFSFDEVGSFKYLTLPADCLSKFTLLELDFSHFIGEYLKFLNFDGLTHLISLTLIYKYSDSSYCNNDILMAISHIRTLKSLKIGSIRVDAAAIQCLGSLTNLRKIELKRVENTIGREMYRMLPLHLPKLTKLTISMRDELSDLDGKSFVELLGGFVDLKYIWHSSVTPKVLKSYAFAIHKGQFPRKRYPIEIGFTSKFSVQRSMLFKIFYDKMFKGFAYLSLEK